MENIKSNESRFQKEYTKINSTKNHRKNKFIFRQDDDIVQENTIVPENIGKKRNIKFNSIDNTPFLQNNSFNNHPSSFRAKEEKQKYENMITEYLTKLYDDPHLRKSLFRKKTAKLRNPDRKVSFANAKNSKAIKNINFQKINKSLFKKNSDNFNKSGSFNNIDILGEQSYGFDKVYAPEIIDSNELMLKSEIMTKKKNLDSRNVRRKHTCKTIKTNNKKLFNLYQIRNPNKKDTNNTNNEFYINKKKFLSNKSNNKKLKSKTLKDKINKDKNYDKIININNNININNEIKKNNSKKSKKKQDADDIETLQKEVKENKKKIRKKQFCCFPFLICLKLKNDEDNENIL